MIAAIDPVLVRRLLREYDRAICAEENAPTLAKAYRLAATSQLCLRRLQAAQAGLPLPEPRPAPATRANRAKAGMAALAAIGRAIARAVRAQAALAKAQAVAAARRLARVGRRALRNVVSFVARTILRAINHQASPRGQERTAAMTDDSLLRKSYRIRCNGALVYFDGIAFDACMAAPGHDLELEHGTMGEQCAGCGQEIVATGAPMVEDDRLWVTCTACGENYLVTVGMRDPAGVWSRS